MRQGVSGVGGDRADTVFGDHRRKQFGASTKRRVPSDLLPLTVDFDHRGADTVGVFVDGAERYALGAQMAPAPDVVVISPDARNAAVSDVNLQAAHGFTQWTRIDVPTVLTGGSRPHMFCDHRLTVDRRDCARRGSEKPRVTVPDPVSPAGHPMW